MKDDLNPTHTPAEVDIPLLKKKEKEKKGAGVVLPQAAAEGAAQVAAGAGVGVAKTGMAALLAGKMGVAALVLGVGGAGLIGVGVMQQQKAEKTAPKPKLDGLSSSIGVAKRNATGSKSLSFMAKAGQGELRWDDPNKPQPQPQAKTEEKTEEDLADAAGAGGPSQEELLAKYGAGAEAGGKEKPSLGRIDAKLSTELGKSSAFGSKSIFSGGTGFDVAQMKAMNKNKLNGSQDRAKSSTHGKLGALRRTNAALNAKNISTRGVRANRAMGQLKFAGRQSGNAAMAGSAGAAASAASGAFEGTKTEGGELSGPGAGGIGDDMPSIQPPGSGAPGSGGGSSPNACPSNWTQVEGGGCQPPDTDGREVTPYQGLLDNAKQMADQAKQLQLAGIALIAIGAILIAIGMWWAVLGVVLLALGVMLVSMASSMSSQAANMGRQISSQYGQEGQGEIVERYGEDANTANDPHNRDIVKDSTVEQDVEAERNSDYTLE